MAHRDGTDSEPVDVLAAEEFAVPAPDPALHHENLILPPDLIGDEAHEVLAAEEFAMPSPDEAHHADVVLPTRNQTALRVAVNLAPLLALWAFRLRRRRKRRSQD